MEVRSRMPRASKSHGSDRRRIRDHRRSRSLPLEPLGLSREDAAAFIGVSATKFDQLVADGRMPAPRLADARVLWSRLELVDAFYALPLRAVNSEEADLWS